MSICTHRDEFDRVWPLLEKALEKEIGGQQFEKEEVWSMLGTEAQIWTTPHSATLISFITAPRMKAMNVWASGGSLKEILGITEPELEVWARENGFSYIYGAGRGAWGRALTKLGFKPVHTTFAKEIKA